MNIRTRIRRAWLGRDLRDRAVSTVLFAENTETAGRDLAWAFIRKVHAEHPNPGRTCTVPDCCDRSTA